MSVELFNEFVSVHAVYLASLLDCFASCGRAVQTVHTHISKVWSNALIVIHDIADYCILCYFKSHFYNLLDWYTFIITDNCEKSKYHCGIFPHRLRTISEERKTKGLCYADE